MISAFIASYGYFAVFIGTLLEGESILLAAGFAAHRGLLDWHYVVLVATFGATAGDQLAFLLGRWKGPSLIQRYPVLSKNAQRVHRLLEHHDSVFILTIRFLYGLRIAGPVIMGTTRISLLGFAILNVTGAIIWASIVTGIGYGLGQTIISLSLDLKLIEETVLIVILILGGIFWVWRFFR